MEASTEDSIKPEEQLIGSNYRTGEIFAKENGINDSDPCTTCSQDQLEQMVVELNFQNEYLKSQFEDMKNLHLKGTIEQNTSVSDDMKGIHEKIESLSRELLEEKETRGAAEKALEHLRTVYFEADAKAQELSAKLAEAQRKMDQEIKERDEKYSELDTKFNRLHKRAKQRIQDVQKEKDDMEAQYSDLKEKAEQAASKQSALQQELERSRQQANEALRAMDADRQQLRSANNKLRDQIEELKHSLEPKENALEELKQSLLEKEKMLEDMRGLLQTAEEKRQAAMTELAAKHQKQIESFESQLAEAMADRSKAAETISSLQGIIVEKESKIAEVDAASSGEAARLKAAVETVKGELSHMKAEHVELVFKVLCAFRTKKEKVGKLQHRH